METITFAQSGSERARLSSVGGHFVMFYSLRRANESSIPNLLITSCLYVIFALFDQTFHGFAGLPTRFLAQRFQNFLESGHMTLCFCQYEP